MNSSFKYRVIKAYCIVFYALMIYKWLNGFLLYQLQPSFFIQGKTWQHGCLCKRACISGC